jgi:hypothetical protein
MEGEKGCQSRHRHSFGGEVHCKNTPAFSAALAGMSAMVGALWRLATNEKMEMHHFHLFETDQMNDRAAKLPWVLDYPRSAKTKRLHAMT